MNRVIVDTVFQIFYYQFKISIQNEILSKSWLPNDAAVMFP